MINKVLTGISKALSKEFGSDYEIYDDEIVQELQEPCFYIQCINPVSKPLLGSRYKKELKFAIQYFPKKGKREIYTVIERLENCLEYIFDGEDLLRGTQMSSEIVDKVLNYFVNYNFFVNKKDIPEEFMEEIQSEVIVKKEEVNG